MDTPQTPPVPPPAAPSSAPPIAPLTRWLLRHRPWLRRLRWLVKALPGVFPKLLSVLAAALLVTLLIKAVFDRTTVIQPLVVPKLLAENGYTPEVAAARLRDEIRRIETAAATTMRRQAVMEQTDLPDITVPVVGTSLQSLAGDLRDLLGLPPRQTVSGEVVTADGRLVMRLRLNGQPMFDSPAGADPQHPDALITDAARAVLDRIEPYILASYDYPTDNTKALDEATRIVARFPPHDEQAIRAINLRGLIFADLGRRDEAMAEYRKAIDLDPKDAYPHYNLGAVLAALGRSDEAMAEFSKAHALNPSLITPTLPTAKAPDGPSP